jgi:transcription elongation factor Elf1
MSATVTLPSVLTCPFCGHPTTVQIDAPVLALALVLRCRACGERWAAAIDQRGVWTTPAAGTASAGRSKAQLSP